MKEFDIIEKFFRPLTNKTHAAQQLKDDVARIALKPDEELVISKDMMAEGVHFLQSDGGFKIASKLLLSNLSDLASSGAKPLYYMLGFSKTSDEKFLKEFVRGLKSVQDTYGLSLIGGDTISSPSPVYSITIFGVAKKKQLLLRSNAKVGDLIFVSGTIGDAFLGRMTKKNSYLQDRHFFPSPRIGLGQELLKQKIAQCAIDVSDGLLADLSHICQSSKVDAVINLDKIPFSQPARNLLKKNFSAFELISGGDDYELIFTAHKKNLKKISILATKLQLEISCIGEIKKSVNQHHELILLDQNQQKVKIKKFGYEH